MRADAEALDGLIERRLDGEPGPLADAAFEDYTGIAEQLAQCWRSAPRGDRAAVWARIAPELGGREAAAAAAPMSPMVLIWSRLNALRIERHGSVAAGLAAAIAGIAIVAGVLGFQAGTSSSTPGQSVATLDAAAARGGDFSTNAGVPANTGVPTDVGPDGAAEIAAPAATPASPDARAVLEGLGAPDARIPGLAQGSVEGSDAPTPSERSASPSPAHETPTAQEALLGEGIDLVPFYRGVPGSRGSGTAGEVQRPSIEAPGSAEPGATPGQAIPGSEGAGRGSEATRDGRVTNAVSVTAVPAPTNETSTAAADSANANVTRVLASIADLLFGGFGTGLARPEHSADAETAASSEAEWGLRFAGPGTDVEREAFGAVGATTQAGGASGAVDEARGDDRSADAPSIAADPSDVQATDQPGGEAAEPASGNAGGSDDTATEPTGAGSPAGEQDDDAAVAWPFELGLDGGEPAANEPQGSPQGVAHGLSKQDNEPENEGAPDSEDGEGDGQPADDVEADEEPAPGSDDGEGADQPADDTDAQDEPTLNGDDGEGAEQPAPGGADGAGDEEPTDPESDDPPAGDVDAVDDGDGHGRGHGSGDENESGNQGRGNGHGQSKKDESASANDDAHDGAEGGGLEGDERDEDDEDEDRGRGRGRGHGRGQGHNR